MSSEWKAYCLLCTQVAMELPIAMATRKLLWPHGHIQNTVVGCRDLKPKRQYYYMGRRKKLGREGQVFPNNVLVMYHVSCI